ncbi:MAG TPA: PQQ-dependent dehydrogenase, methanol/ethanol family [Gammaproteobacteria bacterium]|nr:PQQ-dependent dehydrogenase, methanol/ethanol family [Gammaproteobacteria bacterium]HIL62155.1 PQQ-dependent dehydrogenase, methanol/ethanol family [Porticoccaceae bacterium]
MTLPFRPVYLLGVILASLLCSFVSAQQPSSTLVNDPAMADESQGENWLAFGRTYSEQRFSPLTQINQSNVGGLELEWYVDLPNSRSLVSTPLVVDGIMYFISSMNIVRAVDATSGEELWRYDPQVAQYASRRMRAGWDNSRGIGIWEDKVFVATWDGRLIGIDRNDGRELWSVQTIDPELAMYITGAPKIFKGKVLIGNGGTENGPNRGYITAYDADTGEYAWRFWIVPGNPADGFEDAAMEMAAETWTGEWWRHGGGGNAWHGFTYDAELDQLYIGTGNGSPWNRKIRSPGGGDNLFLSSIVALDPDTGEYLWHYQTAPGDTWDYTSTMDIVLADLTIEGEQVKALMHAPKNGFFYVINRENGELISAENYTEVTWASEVDLETGRPIENPGVRYELEPVDIAPTPIGGHSWHAMSYNPGTGLVYIPTIHWQNRFTDADVDLENFQAEGWRIELGVGYEFGASTRDDGATGTLQAWDPVRQQQIWEIPAEGAWDAGTLTTASNLVFQGKANGHLRAFNALTGEQLWDENLGLGISAPPITYSVNGRQYLAILVGWGGAMSALGGQEMADYGWAYGDHTRRLLAFSLDGTRTVPVSAPPRVPTPLATSDFIVDGATAESGELDYESICSFCHGGAAVAAGMAPDLRASGVILSADTFEQVVRGGALASRGMPPFADFSDAELNQMRHYIRQQAEIALAAGR